jgi:hypothetical protein
LSRPKETLEAWEHALHDVSFADAKEVLASMVRGDLDAVAAYDREKFAAIVRKHAMELHARATLKLPARTETWKDAVKCLKCIDTGFVSVWSRAAMERAKAGQPLDDLQPSFRRCMIRCSCARGFPRGMLARDVRDGDKPKMVERVPRMGEVFAIECPHADVTSGAAIERFNAEVAAAMNRRDERYGGFGEWNNQ